MAVILSESRFTSTVGVITKENKVIFYFINNLKINYSVGISVIDNVGKFYIDGRTHVFMQIYDQHFDLSYT